MKSLDRTLGLADIIAISIGAMLGSGIFVLPGMASAITGKSIWLAYLAAGLCTLPAALAKAEMATAIPRSGGSYVYIALAFGPSTGTITGLGLWLSLLLKSAFALVGFGAYLQILSSALGVQLPAQGMALFFLALIIAMNILGVRKVGKSLIVVVILALSGLAVLIALTFNSTEAPQQLAFATDGLGGFVAATAFVFLSYSGPTKVAAIAEEIKNPTKNIPLGIVGSMLLVGLTYSLVVKCLVDVVPIDQLATNVRPIYTLAEMLGGPGMGIAFAFLGVLALTWAANAGLLAASRFPFAMSRDKLLPSVFARVSQRFITPTWAILATGLAMGLAIVMLDVLTIAKLTSAFKIVVLITVNGALIVLRESHASWYRPKWRSPFYPALPILGILTGLMLISVMGAISLAAVLGVATPGLIIFLIYGRRRSESRGALKRMVGRKDLLTAPAPRHPDDPAELEGEAAAVVLIFGKERSPEELAEVGSALAHGRQVEVVYLTEVPEQTPVSAIEDDNPIVTSLRRRLAAMADEKKVHIHLDEVVTHDVLGSALQLSDRLHCDWMVMEWRGRTQNRLLFITPLGWLVDHLACNLALYKNAGVRYIRQILAHPEPGPDGELVASTADHLAVLEGAEVTFVRFVPDAASPERLQREIDELNRLRAVCEAPSHVLVVRGQNKIEAISNITAAFDLLVTAAAPKGTLLSRLRGAEKDHLFSKATCSVLGLKTARTGTGASKLSSNALFGSHPASAPSEAQADPSDAGSETQGEQPPETA